MRSATPCFDTRMLSGQVSMQQPKHTQTEHKCLHFNREIGQAVNHYRGCFFPGLHEWWPSQLFRQSRSTCSVAASRKPSKLLARVRSLARVLAMRACPAIATAEYFDSSIANSWELMRQKRRARRPQIAGRILPPISEARQFGRTV